MVSALKFTMGRNSEKNVGREVVLVLCTSGAAVV